MSRLRYIEWRENLLMLIKNDISTLKSAIPTINSVTSNQEAPLRIAAFPRASTARIRTTVNGASKRRYNFVPTCFHHTCCSGTGFASVLALKPKRRVKSPANPPTDAIHPGIFASTHGPNMTMPAAPVQETLPIRTQAPERAHHSRSPSPVNRLASPIKSVAAKRKRERKTGTAAQVYQSA